MGVGGSAHPSRTRPLHEPQDAARAAGLVPTSKTSKLLQSTPFWLLVLSHIQNAGSLMPVTTFA